ncbi:hypothetical protein IE53DRAFT_359838 [Violaceomyces palustris]|uniref:Uncharacterized protein n=1 Tax=Violaceomyces palustris TaxID=1673888 RepID=A0ACD0P688_9BASI|nr:hypothetical protein IE53DRAFT_359838 [Violaceomyces palustris]
MPRATFLDTILNRPSQSYSASDADSRSKSKGSKSGWVAPTDLPNASGKPQSILSGSMFKSKGKGSLSRANGGDAPSISGISQSTTKFSRFGKKKRAPSVANSTIFDDGASSVAPGASVAGSVSNRKSRWWESGSLRIGKGSSRPPSVSGSIFSEPEAPAVPSRYPSLASMGAFGSLPRRGARSDYGGGAPVQRYRTHSAAPPLPTVHSKSSMTSFKGGEGVVPLGAKQPSLIRRPASRTSLNQTFGSMTDFRPTSPSPSEGRSSIKSGHGGSADWNNFIKQMEGTEVAKTWKGAKGAVGSTGVNRPSVKDRILKELEQDAACEQIKSDPGVARQDLLTRAANQVIGQVSPVMGAPKVAPVQATGIAPGTLLKPGLVVPSVPSLASAPPPASTSEGQETPLVLLPRASLDRDLPPAPVVGLVPTPSSTVPPAQIHDQVQPPQGEDSRRDRAAAQPTTNAPFVVAKAPPRLTHPQVGEVNTGSAAGEHELGEAHEVAEESEESEEESEEESGMHTLDVVAEEDEENSSNGHYHNEMASPSKRKHPSRRYASALEAAMASRPEHDLGSSPIQPSSAWAPAIAIKPSTPETEEVTLHEAAFVPLTAGKVVADSGPLEDKRTNGTFDGRIPDKATYDAEEVKLAADQRVMPVSPLEHEPASALAPAPVPVPVPVPVPMPMPMPDVESREDTKTAAEVNANVEGKSEVGSSTRSDSVSSIQPKAVKSGLAEEEEKDQSSEDEENSKENPGTGTSSVSAFARPPMVSRMSSDYQSAASMLSGRSTPTNKGVAFDGSSLTSKRASGRTVSDASVSSENTSRDIGSVRSSRPPTLQRRLSDVSLGASFKLNGITGLHSRTASMRSSSRMFKMADSDSDSQGDDGSGEDEDLKRKAMAEQDRLRQMNVGDDFFGPSLSNILDRFSKMNWSDSTLNRVGLDVSLTRSGDAVSVKNAMNANAQERINEVRRARARGAGDDDAKTRASSAGGLVPSFADLWLAQVAAAEASNEERADQTPAAESDLPRTASSASASQTTVGRFTSLFSSPQKPSAAELEAKVSIMDRPRYKPNGARAVDEATIPDGTTQRSGPSPMLDGPRSTLPTSFSVASDISDATIGRSVATTLSPARAFSPGPSSKDKPPPPKSAMKALKPSKSLADTLFSFNSPEKKKEKARLKSGIQSDKARRSKKSEATKSEELPAGRVSSSRSDRSISSVNSSPQMPQSPIHSTKSAESINPAAQVPPPISEKAVGKRREEGSPRNEDLASAKGPTSEPGSADQLPPMSANAQQTDPNLSLSASETLLNFVTPAQSSANLVSETPAKLSMAKKMKQFVMETSSPEKFHTAVDLQALSGDAPDSPSSPRPYGPLKRERMVSEDIDKVERPQVPITVVFNIRPSVEENRNPIEAKGSTLTADVVDEAYAVQSSNEKTMLESTASASSIGENDADLLKRDLVESESRVGPSSPPLSTVSTALTTPGTSEVVFNKAYVPREAVVSEENAVVASRPATIEKKLPMPPPPEPHEVVSMIDDKTPTAASEAMKSAFLGVNLIPPTPPALESRQSYTGSHGHAPSPLGSSSTDAEANMKSAPNRPGPTKRTSSGRNVTSGLQNASGLTSTLTTQGQDSLVRSKSATAGPKKNVLQHYTEYKGKGLSLPPGLVATTVASSASRRQASEGSIPSSTSMPVATPSYALAKNKTNKKRVSDLPSSSATDSMLPDANTRQTTMPMASPPSSPKRKKSSISPSSSIQMMIADAPPVPQIPAGYQSSSPSLSGSSSSRLRLPKHPNISGNSTSATSSADSDTDSVSPAPSASGRSNVSSSIHSLSMSHHRSSPTPEYSYTQQPLSPHALKLRNLSTGLGAGQGPTPRQSIMSAISEWERQSPVGSEPSSPRQYPPLPASVTSTSSSTSGVISPSVVRNAPLGAATNHYLHPPVPKSRRSTDEDQTANGSHLEPAFPIIKGFNSPYSGSVVQSAESSPTASQSNMSVPLSVVSLPSTMPSVPTSYRPNKDPKRVSRTMEDLLHNRTTMNTVSVSSGAFPTRSKSVLRRKQSVDTGLGVPSTSNRSSMEVPDHLKDELDLTTISLTAHMPPPRKLTSNQVLVQVIAVAIDEMDRLLLREKVRSENAFGYVPGRSFSGRVLECGYEVKKMRKGDIVFGLQDSRKCGALAEYMTIDSNLVCHAPSDCLTTEQIAALPSAGVMAHQIMLNHCSQLPRGSRVLILNAHDGIGLLIMQESVGLGLIIVAQCPPSVSDALSVCQANGAHEVVVGEPLWAINSLHESSFDLVVDTIGGRKIYDASRRILSFEGQFTTCYGDEHSTANPNLRSHLRSLRRAFFKKDKKNIGYEWVGADSGDDCKEALESVKAAAEAGSICPRLRSVLPFADAPRAFDPTLKIGEGQPGAIVVRVS